MSAEAVPELRRQAQEELPDASKFCFFDESSTVLCASWKVSQPEQELGALRAVFESGRETAVRAGVRIQGSRYEVHRFDPPLIYGRTMGGEPVHSEAFALCRLDAGPTGKPAYAVITFLLPQLTARMVPKLMAFCERHLRPSKQEQQQQGEPAPV